MGSKGNVEFLCLFFLASITGQPPIPKLLKPRLQNRSLQHIGSTMCKRKAVHHLLCNHRLEMPQYCQAAPFVWSAADGRKIQLACIEWQMISHHYPSKITREKTNTRFCTNCHRRLLQSLREEIAAKSWSSLLTDLWTSLVTCLQSFCTVR